MGIRPVSELPSTGSTNRRTPGFLAAVDFTAVVEGFLLGSYRFTRYRSTPEPAAVERLDVLATNGSEALSAIVDARRVAAAVTSIGP